MNMQKKPPEDPEIFEAIYRNDIAGCLELLNAGLDLETRNNTGYTPLHLAAIEGRAEILDMLLRHGANLEAKNREYGDRNTPMHMAAAWGNVVICEILLKHGADIEAKGMGGGTPLFAAAYSQDCNTCECLIEYGADIEARNDDGETALFAAIRSKEAETCRTLIRYGANIEAKNDDGETPLLLASIYANTENCLALLEYGANTEAKDNDGLNSLELAVLHHSNRVEKMEFEIGSADKSDLRAEYEESMLTLCTLIAHSACTSREITQNPVILATLEMTPLEAAATLDDQNLIVKILDRDSDNKTMYEDVVKALQIAISTSADYSGTVYGIPSNSSSIDILRSWLSRYAANAAIAGIALSAVRY